MQVCQITGYKNSGKTTVMNHLIWYFFEEGKRVASLKHHGHGGEPDMTDGTDSQQHFESGSVISGVQGATVTQLTFQMPLELDTFIRMYEAFSIDLLFVEGYKKADYPKIILIKNSEDLLLLDELSNITAVGTWDMDLMAGVDCPVFDINALQAHIQELAETIKGDL